MRTLLRFAVNAVALVAAAQLVPGIHLQGTEAILVTALIFGVINAIIRPVVMLVTCPIQVITLGLFTLAVNTAMLLLTAWLAQRLGVAFSIEDLAPAFWGALVISFVSLVLARVVR